MSPTPQQRKAAETMKAEGNQLFARQKYSAAAERYTEAITLDPDKPVYYVNRGMCHKKLGMWERVAADAAAALALDKGSLKAHYLMGLALREKAASSASAPTAVGAAWTGRETGTKGVQQGQAAEAGAPGMGEAIKHLTRALEAAREADDAIKDEIWRELARTKYAAWHTAAEVRQRQAAALRTRLRAALDMLAAEEAAAGAVEQAAARATADWEAVEALFTAAAAADQKREVPSAYTCPLTMEVFREPASTPGGGTYERAVLIEHLTTVGGFDPVTRAPMTPADVRPNVALRAATQQYLDDHPWAWGECI